MVSPESSSHILIIEEDRAIGDLLQYFLEGEHYHTTLVSSLEEASAALGSQTYHLILVDLFRPSPQLLLLAVEELQQQWTVIPVGMLSSWEFSPMAIQHLRLAFFLPKPFDLDQLLAAVATTVHKPDSLIPCGELPVQPDALPASL